MKSIVVFRRYSSCVPSKVCSFGVPAGFYIYPKNAQEDLTPGQERLLAGLVREEFK
jgi:hypothetical protein